MGARKELFYFIVIIYNFDSVKCEKDKLFFCISCSAQKWWLLLWVIDCHFLLGDVCNLQLAIRTDPYRERETPQCRGWWDTWAELTDCLWWWCGIYLSTHTFPQQCLSTRQLPNKSVNHYSVHLKWSVLVLTSHRARLGSSVEWLRSDGVIYINLHLHVNNHKFIWVLIGEC